MSAGAIFIVSELLKEYFDSLKDDNKLIMVYDKLFRIKEEYQYTSLSYACICAERLLDEVREELIKRGVMGKYMRYLFNKYLDSLVMPWKIHTYIDIIEKRLRK